MRLFKGLVGLIVLMLLATGCFRVEGKIVVEDDGSGSVNLLSALNAGSLTSVLGDFDIPESELGGTDELCNDFTTDFGGESEYPAGARVTPYDEDGYCGARVELTLPPSTNHDQLVTDLFDSPSELHKEGDNWLFSTDFDTEDLGVEDEGVPPGMLDSLFGDASFEISVQLPGRPVEGQHNATSVDGNTFKWELDLLNAPDTLFAQTEPGSVSSSGGTNWLLIGLVVAGLLALAALAWFLINKRSAESSATETSSPGIAPFDAQPAAMPIAAEPASAAPEMVITEPVAAEPASAPAPVYDETLGAWVIDDPARGRLQHDPETDTWRPVQ